MDPRWLLPLLAAVFAALALHKALRQGASHPAVRGWALVALIFAGVSLWLHTAA
jgi:hypothetical protein